MLMLSPTTGPVTSGYGVPHRAGGPTQYAVDWGFYMADPASKNLRAVASATVVYAGPAAGYRMHSDFGTLIVLQWSADGFTWEAIYCHIARAFVSSGPVSAGQVIAVMGATGYVFGIHLHFILRRNGIVVNPLNYVSAAAGVGGTPIVSPARPLTLEISMPEVFVATMPATVPSKYLTKNAGLQPGLPTYFILGGSPGTPFNAKVTQDQDLIVKWCKQLGGAGLANPADIILFVGWAQADRWFDEALAPLSTSGSSGGGSDNSAVVTAVEAMTAAVKGLPSAIETALADNFAAVQANIDDSPADALANKLKS